MGSPVLFSILEENHFRPFHDGIAQETSVGPGIA